MQRRDLRDEEDDVRILAAELIDDEAVSAENARQRIAAPDVVGRVLHEHDLRLLRCPTLKLRQRAVARLRRTVRDEEGHVVSTVPFRHQVRSARPTALVVEVRSDEVEVRMSFGNQLLREKLWVAGAARD